MKAVTWHGERDVRFAEPARPGKAIYATASGTDGVLIGWTPPPAMPSSEPQPPS
jgi:S-DNA-T family DNA segregation ATPase FtsK/SpoIIIE